MVKYLVSVSYDGSYFKGWAKQPNSFTVQGFIEKRISSTFNQNVFLSSSSRTDSGVHAIDQKFTFSLDLIKIQSSRMKTILNDSLKNFVGVNEVEIVDKNFNLRKNILLKEYHYLIILDNYNIFHKKYFLDASKKDLDIKMFEESLKMFEGYHDFFNFSYVKEKDKSLVNTFKIIEKINVDKINNDVLRVKFFSKGFLRYQIRAIIGECIDKHKSYQSGLILSSMLKCEKKMKYKKIADSSGLYLWKVYLNEQIK